MLKMLDLLQKHLGKKANLSLMPMQAGDLKKTAADVSKARKELGYNPRVGIDEGIKQFVDWFVDYDSRRSNRIS